MNGDEVRTSEWTVEESLSDRSDALETHRRTYARILRMPRRLDEGLAGAVDDGNRVIVARAYADLWQLAGSPGDVVAALDCMCQLPCPRMSGMGRESH